MPARMTSVLVVAPLVVVLADDTLRKWFGASLAVRAPWQIPKPTRMGTPVGILLYSTRTEVMRAGSNMGPGGQGEGGAQWVWT